MNIVTENFEKEMIAWRHDFHAHPELNFDLDITSAKVAEILKSFGLEVFEGIGKKGIVAVLKNGNSNKSIGIRADMDALPVKKRVTAHINPLMKEKCMRVVTMAIQQWLSVQPNIFLQQKILMARFILFSNLMKKKRKVHKQ